MGEYMYFDALMLSGQLPGGSSLYYFTYIEAVLDGVVDGFFTHSLCTLNVNVLKIVQATSTSQNCSDTDVVWGSCFRKLRKRSL
ncbi:hypothetical protein Tco_0450944 [Tanacetum coccineum]